MTRHRFFRRSLLRSHRRWFKPQQASVLKAVTSPRSPKHSAAPGQGEGWAEWPIRSFARTGHVMGGRGWHPSGMRRCGATESGGVARAGRSLNHRLLAGKPPTSKLSHRTPGPAPHVPHAGGMKARSRWLSVATPPVNRFHPPCTPAGVPASLVFCFSTQLTFVETRKRFSSAPAAYGMLKIGTP